MATNAISTVNGSSILNFADVNASAYRVGDIINISGATAFNGITTGQINTLHVVHTVGVNTWSTIVSTNATATGTGGGASITKFSGLIAVTATSHGLANGSRVKISGAADIGGISAATYINQEFVMRYIDVNRFFIVTQGMATSSVSNGGGAGTLYQKEIPAGAVDESIGQGYGMGLYGVGLYGVALLSSSALQYPRIWFISRFGTNVILTAGNQTGIYSWGGSNNTAPTLVANAPTAVNYAFVSNNILVTLGAGGIPNRIFASDQSNITQWTSSSSNQVFDYTEVKAGQFRTHVSVAGVNLIFTDYQTYLFSYLGYTAGVANAIWSLQLLENNIGIIAPMARCAVAGVAYWMGQNNFYMWAGGNVSIIPSNTQTQSTILNYVFGNINRGQAAKCFAWFNELFDEIWFHYPSQSSNECDSVARFNRTDLTWTMDTFDRLCAEYPNNIYGYPRLIDSNAVLYNHEIGTDANGSPMTWTLQTNVRGGDFSRNSGRVISSKNYMLTAFVPDSVQTGNINVEIISKRFPQSPQSVSDANYTITPTTEFMPTQSMARLWQYKLTGSAIGQKWQGGQWHDWVKEGSPL